MQPLASVTVKAKGPADTLVCAPSPVYGGVPPEAVMFTVSSATKQPIGSCVSLALSAGGWLDVAGHLSYAAIGIGHREVERTSRVRWCALRHQYMAVCHPRR